MRHSIIAILAFAPIIILSSGAVYMAINGIWGWGFFLVGALFAGGSYTYREKG